MPDHQSNHRRWHDKDPVLSALLEKIQRLDEREQDQMMIEVKYIINKYDHTLIGKHIEEYKSRRRWYDKNPYTWLVINALKYSPPQLLDEVKSFLQSRL